MSDKATIKITVYHERTIHANEQSGFTIASYKTEDSMLIPEDARSKYQPRDGKTAFTGVGNRLPTTKDVEIELVGKWEDGKFGKQLKIASCTVLRPKTTEGIAVYLASDLIKGIGESTAKAIVDKFGVDTLDIIDKTPERLIEVQGITEKKLKIIIETYNNSAGLRDIMTALADYGVTPKKAEKIREAFGAQAADIVKENPYVLCKINGFGFKTVDKMAKKKGFAPDNPQRIKESVIYALSEAQQSGHLYLGNGKLTLEALKLLEAKKVITDTTSQSAMSTSIKHAILELVMENRLQEENRMIYLPHNFIAERETAKLVKAMIRKTPLQVDIGITAEEKISVAITEAEASQGINLADKQREAVSMAVMNHFSIITGGPGTGKTTVVKALVEIYKKVSGGTVAFAAPTGRASRRLSESVEDDAATLHSVLGLKVDSSNITSNAQEKAKNVISADLLIVDESSMIDMKLAHQLFKSLKSTTKLILVGDFNQLPSVGAGNVFRELLLCGAIPVTRLDVVHRQAQTSRINLNAHAILKNKADLLYGPDFEFIQTETSEEAVEQVKQLYFKYIKAKDANGKTYGADGVQILSPMRGRGKCCVNALNKDIQSTINPKTSNRPEITVGFNTFRLFDKIMQTKNNGEVSNGDVGRIRAIKKDDDGVLVTIDFGGGRMVKYSQEEMETIDLAYSTTIHKSQGSEYPVVIIPVLTEAFILLQRNLIYTAITRAKTKVILVGQKKALYTAIHKSEMVGRNTVLGRMVVQG